MKLSRTDGFPLLAIAAGAILGAVTFGAVEDVLDDDFDEVVDVRNVVVRSVSAEARVTPGTEARIRLSGHDFTGQRPLVYIDGVRVSGTDLLTDVDPGDIDRLEVVKGEAARTLYGDEAAAGVVQVFLKPGAQRDSPNR